MEAMTMIEKHYTPDQLSQLEARRRDLSEEGMQKAQEDWTELIAAVEAERSGGPTRRIPACRSSRRAGRRSSRRSPAAIPASSGRCTRCTSRRGCRPPRAEPSTRS
jgi:hypothetical protein